MRQQFAPAALICAVLANLHRDEEKKPEPFTLSDFMPGQEANERDDLLAFAEAVVAGEALEADPQEFAKFRREFQKTTSRGELNEGQERSGCAAQ